MCVSVIFPTDKEEEAVFPIKLPLLSPFLALQCVLGKQKRSSFFCLLFSFASELIKVLHITFFFFFSSLLVVFAGRIISVMFPLMPIAVPAVSLEWPLLFQLLLLMLLMQSFYE